MRPLATLLSPLINRLLYPGAETSQSAQEPDVELMVGGIALRGWEVNPGQDRALVYYGGNGEAPGKIPDLAVVDGNVRPPRRVRPRPESSLARHPTNRRL